MSEEDVEINVDVDDGMTVVIGPDKETSKPKRKRGKDKEPSPKWLLICKSPYHYVNRSW
jgi:hypothetical protein